MVREEERGEGGPEKLLRSGDGLRELRRLDGAFLSGRGGLLRGGKRTALAWEHLASLRVVRSHLRDWFLRGLLRGSHLRGRRRRRSRLRVGHLCVRLRRVRLLVFGLLRIELRRFYVFRARLQRFLERGDAQVEGIDLGEVVQSLDLKRRKY